MTARMLLDESGDNPVAAGYTRVADEVTFLRLALSRSKLHVCGEIGAWAAALCEARGWECRRLSAPTAELIEACPGLDPAGASALVERLRPALDSLERPLQPLAVAATLWPTAGLWTGEPDATHAATWLAWLIETSPPAADHALLAAVAATWRAAPIDGRGAAAAYGVTTGDGAWETVKAWLGVAPSGIAWPPFPLKPLPEWLVARLRAEWSSSVIVTDGRFFERIAEQGPDPDVLRLAAIIAADYFELHPEKLSAMVWQRLEPLLSAERRRDLEAMVFPADPGDAPKELEAAIAWFQGPYLRYRVWEAAHGREEHRERRRALAYDFGAWFVSAYARAVSGGPGNGRLIWSKTATLAAMTDRVTLLVVLDGLGYRDARHLLANIRERSTRLTVVADDVALAPLPTITDFAKPALLAGVTSARAVDEARVGVAEHNATEVIGALDKAAAGEIVIWSLPEPDKTYHRQVRGDDAAHDVAGVLMALAKRIVAVVHGVREDCALRLVIATDHGRLLSIAARRAPVPPLMVARGRAAWGASDESIGVEGYRVEGNLAFLDADRFSISQKAAVLLSDESFLAADGKGGDDPYPHGGVYPEEVFIPWLEFLRDALVAPPEVTLTGDGVAGAEGEMTLQVVNEAHVSVRLDSLTVPALGWTIGLGGSVVEPVARQEITLRRAPWPRPAELADVKAQLAYRLPDGERRDQAVILTLTSEELYTRRDDILSDLE
jgi:hypothetical protein